MSSTNLLNVSNDDALQLTSILFQCFAVIILGYVSGRLSIISETQSRGITNFVSFFSLPSLIFLSLARCDLSAIDWYFVASVFISKVIVFVLVVIITLLVTRPCNLGKAGLYGMLVTQSNDFAIGYPILSSLYDSSQPHFADYLYVVAPLQLLFINPCGLFLLEMYKYRQAEDASSSVTKTRTIVIIGTVLKNTITNPIVVMTLAGLIWNLFLGNTVPEMLAGLCQSLANAFSSTSLFLLGLNIVQETGLIGNSAKIMVPCTLSAVKLFILPVILRLVTQYLVRGTENYVFTMASFAFLYGTIPCAPTSVIFALIYNLGSWVTSYALIVSTIISAPLLFVSANMIRYSEYTPEQVTHDLCLTIYTISLIAIPCAVWTLFIFICGRKWTSITHRVTFGLLITQLIVAVGGYLMPHDSTVMKLRYFVPEFGIFASRIWTALLALTFALLRKRSLCFVLRVQNFLFAGAFLLTIIMTLTLYLVAPYSPESSIDPFFKFGSYQTLPSLALTTLSAIITGIAIISQQRDNASANMYSRLNVESSVDSGRESPVQPIAVDVEQQQQPEEPSNSIDADAISIEDLVSSTIVNGSCQGADCSNTHRRKSCLKYLQRYLHDTNDELVPVKGERLSLSFQRHIQQTHHLALLLILLLSMIIDFAVSVSKLFNEKFTGIHVELVSLDIFLVYGQAISTFVLFGLDTTTFIDIWRRLCFHFSLDNSNHHQQHNPQQSTDITINESHYICHQFSTYHLEKCAKDICFLISCRKSEVCVFKGCDLVNWLLKSGLTTDRKSGRTYATNLLRGHLIRSLDRSSHFLDASTFYQFLTVPRSSLNEQPTNN
ncbi:integral membrane protein GPR155-like [Panonychus citri]|uniref:integral membrane protein GPR155-like n=1 Tax=Panonychus citri TaxID=50023 RepID=UPI0023078B5A|nr:integral membrane protein GPR155-like [Panonychus citri]